VPSPSSGSLVTGTTAARRSCLTGADLPTWWVAYYIDRKEQRESAHSTDVEVARRLLRTWLHAVDEGMYVGPGRERLTVNALLDALLDFHAVQGHLSADVFLALAAHLDVGRRQFFEFCSLTGKRKGQMSRTAWAHYDAAAQEFTWSAAEVKAKRPEVLPLAGQPLALIEALYAGRRLHCRDVFHGPRCGPGHRASQEYGCVGDFKKVWHTACARAGFPIGRKDRGYVFHNTWHTAVTNLVNAGVPAHEAMAVSGHRTRSVFDRYSLTLKAQTRAALERVSISTAALPLPRRSRAAAHGGVPPFCAGAGRGQRFHWSIRPGSPFGLTPPVA
jgi:integrase